MNTEVVISLPVSATDLEPYRRVVYGASGLAYAGATDSAIGTLLPADPGGDQAGAVHNRNVGLHFATIGNDTNIAVGDELQGAADGKLVKRTTGPLEAIACEACTDEDDIIRVVYVAQAAAAAIVAAGIHTWAGGAATTDSIAVVGLEAGDVVLATLSARASTETLVLAVNDAANDQIDLTLSANGTDGTTKISYQVLRG